MHLDKIPVQINQIRLESPDTASFDLVPLDTDFLPPCGAGAHVDIEIPGGLQRSYSLLLASSRPHYYRIAVKRENDSRGGSAWFHDTARVGARIQISPPVNDFALIENAQHSVFIAGGIGITPFLSMAERLNELGRTWDLHYSARRQTHMPFLESLDRLASKGFGTVLKHVTGDTGRRMDLESVIQSTPAGAHLYCCGPRGLIDAFIVNTQRRLSNCVHYERFNSSQEAAVDGGFDVQLIRTGRTLPVPQGKSILDVLLDAGINAPFACTQGICGTCKVKVVSGTPDHRDDCLTDEERAAGDVIITCCSGSSSRVLSLDL
jgi:vanillate O-demethylase ferredoxin subunit